MSKSITLRPRWTDKHREYMQQAVNSTISVAEGAVRAGKTVDNVAAFACMLERGVPDRIHLATGSTAANAKLNIGDCNGFGLEHIFRGRCRWTKYKGNEALEIKAAGRKYVVIFAGGAKADSFKKIRGNSYGMWIATEINLHLPATIQEAFNRQLAAIVRRVFWDLNPSAPSHFIYSDYIDKFPEAYGERYNYQHFTIRDNATITPQRLAEIEAQYDPNSVWYKRDILGQRVAAEGRIYDMWSDDIHTTAEDLETEGPWYVSSDYGIQNATTFLPFRKVAGLDAYYCPDEYYYSGREERRQKTVSELADGLEGLLGRLNADKPKDITVDPSAAALIVELRKRGYTVRSANNDVINGIADVSSMLYDKRLIFNKRCKNTIAEFNSYAWDQKASEAGEDRPIKENDHAMDAVRYFVKTHQLARKSGSGKSRSSSIFM